MIPSPHHAKKALRIALAVSLLQGVFLAAPAWFRELRAEDGAVLVAPRKVYAGGKSSLTLTTFDSATRQPVARAFAVVLLSPEGAQVATISAGATGSSGHRQIEFDVPPLGAGTYKIQASITGVSEKLEVSTTLSRAPGILLETDKPIYKPSQRIQGRVILLDNGLRPLAGAVEVTFHDGKGVRIDRKQLLADEFGVAAFSLDLAKELNFGTWKIRARSEGSESVRDVRVEEYTLPHYDLSVKLPKSWALVDEPIEGSVEAKYFFGKDVEGTGKVIAKRYVGTWEDYASASGNLSAGKLAFRLPPVGFVAGTPGSSGQGSVTLEVSVTDSTGHTQTTTEAITIAEAPVVLTLISRSKDLKPGIPLDLLVGTKGPDGSVLSLPVNAHVAFRSDQGAGLGESDHVVNTVDGQGTLSLTPPANTAFAELTARAQLSGHETSAVLYVGSAFSTSGSFLSLARTGGDAPAAVGQVLSFSVVSTHPGTVYYEVYAGGRTVLSDASESDTFSIHVTPDMSPRAKVVAYKINPDNEVAADSLSFDVKLSVSVTLNAGFSADQVKPGDPVQVTVDAGTGRRTLLGVSIVDQSVLALGQSRLHLADVFAELERRFLEPEAEVHEGGGGGAPGGGPVRGGIAVDGGPGGGFFESPRTRGALDTLHEAGLEIAVTKGITVPAGGEIDFWRGRLDAAEDGGPVAPGANPAAGGGGGVSAPPRVRQYFPETWLWEPLLLTDDAGRTTLDLTAPDSITGWKLAVVGTSPGASGSAGITFGEDDLKVFQDFFVDLSLPYSVVRGEVFPVKVDLFNYAEEDQSVELSLDESAAFEMAGDSSLTVTVPAGSTSSVRFPIRPTKLGEFPLSLHATGSSLADAVVRQILVVPEGRPVEIVSNSVIDAGASAAIDLSIPPEAVSGSARAYLNITPSPVSQTLSGVSDLLGMPYGCGEQNMIFTAPDIEILKYLRELGELSVEIRATAEYYVNVGYQRELTFGTDDGGFAAFGGAQGSLWLTAFVLSTFSGAREVRDIDESVLSRAASLLVSRQKADGSFQTDNFLIHQEMDGGLGNIYAMAAYVTNALADYILAAPEGTVPAEVTAAVGKGAGYLAESRTTLPGIKDDAYSLSIAAVALQKAPGFSAAAEATLDRLVQLGKTDGVGIHWEPYPVESTGYSAMALLLSNGGVGRPEAAGAVDWLSTQRNSLGGYGESTQDTVVAIRALFLAARKVHRNLDATLTVQSGETTLFTLHVDSSNYDLFHQFELPLNAEEPPINSPGSLDLKSAGKGSVGFQVVKRFNVPGDLLPPPRDMLIDVFYDASHIEVDDKLDVRVTLKYTGYKEKTGMVIADIGVPTGFDAVRASLDALVSAKTASRVEVAGRKVIFYIDALLKDKPLSFTFQIWALYPVSADGPISRVYEYYDQKVEAYHHQQPLTVLEGPPKPRTFRRGDSNSDGAVNLSDAVTTLNDLFLGVWTSPQPLCEDAADSNDDGLLNITDPIYILNFLFLGSAAPPAPYPDPGEDPTADKLKC